MALRSLRYRTHAAQAFPAIPGFQPRRARFPVRTYPLDQGALQALRALPAPARPYAGDGVREGFDAPRVSFEAGMNQLGGIAINLNRHDTQLSRGEPIEDLARVISRMVDVVMIRTFEQAIIERFAAHSRVPVINGLTNEYHPCQILADIYTYVEHRGSIAGRTVAWIGDSNNVCRTWLQAATLLGFSVHVSTPPGYEIRPATGARDASHFRFFADPHAACHGADLVTTDVWTSMGFEAENEERKRDFARWRVDAEMLRHAKPDAVFMHCLPAHRGEEVAAEVIDGPQSVVWDQAENRLHAQR